MKTTLLKRYISIILVLAMMVTSIPMTSAAQESAGNSAYIDTGVSVDADEEFTEQPAMMEYDNAEDSRILYEETEMRNENTKYFRLKNGNMIAAQYEYPVHYYSNGEWQDINNSLITDNGTASRLITAQGEYEASFSGTTGSGELLSYGNAENGVISMDMEGIRSNVTPQVENDSMQATVMLANESMYDVTDMTAQEYNDSVMAVDNLVNTVTYNNVLEDTDLEYIVAPGYVKENIIVNSALQTYEYTFDLNTNDLIPVQIDSQTIGLYSGIDYDSDSEVITQYGVWKDYDWYNDMLRDEARESLRPKNPFKYMLEANAMIDAAGQESYDVGIDLISNPDGQYQVEVWADENWINDSERVFPVKIDPTVETGRNKVDYEDGYVVEGRPTENNSLSNAVLKLGYDPSYGKYHSYIKFGLPDLYGSSQIVSASMKMKGLSSNLKGYDYIVAYRVTSNWSEGTLTWNTKPSNSEDALTYEPAEPNAYDKAGDDADWTKMDVTKAVKGWYSGLYENYGLLIKLHKENYSSRRLYDYLSKSYSPVYRPFITIEYLDVNGIEGKYTYHSASAGQSGTSYVNDFTGHHTYVHNDFSMNGNLLPISFDHVWNQRDNSSQILNNNMKLGKGWRLSAVESISATEGDIAEEFPYVYTDGDGTEHYFKDSETTNEYLLETDESVKLIIGTTVKYTITDDSGAEQQFNYNNTASGAKYGETWYMTKLKDENGNEQVYTWNNLSQLVSITDGSKQDYKRTVTFTYDSNGYLSKFNDPAGRETSFTYSDTDGTLSKMQYPSAAGQERYTTFIYGSEDNLLKEITSYDNSKLEITYSDKGLNKVSNILQKGTSGTEGGKLTFAYSEGETTVTDRDGNSESMMFDLSGRTVTVRDGNGYGVFGSWEDGETAKNLLQYQSETQKSVINILKENEAETASSSEWYDYSENKTDGSVASATSYAHYGNRSMSVYSPTASGIIGVAQDITVTGGKSYTFSAYMKVHNFNSSEKGAFLAIQYDDGGETVTEKSPYTVIQNGWQRYTVTAAIPEDVDEITVIAGQEDSTGYTYYDSFQLEESSTASEYNLLENGSLERISNNLPTGWTASSDCSSNDKSVELTGRSGNGMKITGDIGKARYISQTVKISGTKDDKFLLSGWAKAASIKHVEGQRIFALALKFNYTDGTNKIKYINFESYAPDWQYISQEIQPEKAFSTVEVMCAYVGNLNTAYFDDIQLSCRYDRTKYEYDDKGNVTKEIFFDGAYIEYTYDEKDNCTSKKQYSKSGVKLSDTSYEYDERNNVTKISDNMYTPAKETTYTYDSVGNVIKVESETSRTETTYTSSGQYAASSSDEFGNTVSYTYNEAKGLTISATDAKGNVTSYAYNANTDELLIVSGNADVNGTASPISNSYVYEDGMLESITHNGFNYNFEYDEFGNRLAVKIGEGDNAITLSENTYAENNGELTKTTYGNGNIAIPTYNELDIVTKMEYSDVDESYNHVYTWDYGNNGQLGAHGDEVNQLEWLYRYDDDGKLVTVNADRTGGEHYVDDLTYRYTYDTSNRLTGTSYLVNGTRKATGYSYDEKNRPFLTTFPNSSTVGITFDDESRVSAETITRSSYTYTTQYTYDTGTNDKTTGRVSGISYTRGEEAKGGYTYEYDGNGNITEIYEGETLKASYHYDAQNQLVREDNMDLGTVGQTVVYAYDAGGNILSKKTYAYTDPATAVSGTPIDTVNYSYTDTVWKDKLTSFDGKAITYDEIGNPLTYGTGDEQWSFTWQRGRQLAGLTTPDHTISYKYNADGLRTEKTVDGVTWEYIWDGSKLIAMYDGTTEWRFIYDAGGEVIGFICGSSTYYYVKNLQGDVIKILDNYCNEVVTYTYDSWGNVIAQGGSNASAYVSLGQKNPIRYRGYFYDTDTGLYYLQSRYYNPQWGRFINSDGTLLSNYGIKMHNMYIYCSNNPVNSSDPTGYCPCPWKAWCSCPPTRSYNLVQNAKVIVSTVTKISPVNHVVNYVNKKKIEKEVKSSYTQDEAKEKIESIMSLYQRNPVVTFDDSSQTVEIKNSIIVNSVYDRQRIGMILANTEGFEREYDNIAAEWNVHNFGYAVLSSVEYALAKVNISSTWVTDKVTRSIDVGIDYVKDDRWQVRLATTAFEVVGWD